MAIYLCLHAPSHANTSERFTYYCHPSNTECGYCSVCSCWPSRQAVLHELYNLNFLFFSNTWKILPFLLTWGSALGVKWGCAIKSLPDSQLLNRSYEILHFPISFQNMFLVHKMCNTEEMSKPIRPGSRCSNPEVKPSHSTGGLTQVRT